MSLHSSLSPNHTIGKATPTTICESYDITVRCNAGKSLFVQMKLLLWKSCFLVWMMLIDSKIHIILYPTQKIQLCIKQHHSKVGTDAIVIVILMRQSDAGLMQSSFRTTEKTTPIKYLLDHKQLAISGLKKKKKSLPLLTVWCISISSIFRSQSIYQEFGHSNHKILSVHCSIRSL